MRSRSIRRIIARNKWDRLRVSFWFIPLVMSLGAILLAWVLYELDMVIPNEALQHSRFIISGSPDELRVMLIGMAATILATAGVVFSLLTLPLSTIAAQYGSRLLRVFLGDRTTQLILGMFACTFAYCIAAALSILPSTIQPEGPQVMATMGLLLMLLTFASLIWLIHHIGITLQAPNIAAAAGRELMDVIQVEYSAEAKNKYIQGQTDSRSLDISLDKEGYPVCLGQVGYIQYINLEYMITLAQEKNFAIRLLHKPGDFIRSGTAVALIWPANQVDKQLDQQIRRAFQIGNHRTPTQDIEFAVNQLVEMAVRAMSPAINDPFTAMTCLDYIENGMVLFIQQGEQRPNIYDQDGKLHLVLEPITFRELLSAAFDMIRHASSDNARVLLHMLGTIEAISQVAELPDMRHELLHQIEMVNEEIYAGELIEEDRSLIYQKIKALQKKLDVVT